VVGARRNKEQHMTFRGDFLKARRKLNGLTMRALAKKLKVAPSQVSRWETKNQEPYPRQINLLAKVLKVRPEDLFQLKGKEQLQKLEEGESHGRQASATTS